MLGVVTFLHIHIYVYIKANVLKRKVLDNNYNKYFANKTT